MLSMDSLLREAPKFVNGHIGEGLVKGVAILSVDSL